MTRRSALLMLVTAATMALIATSASAVPPRKIAEERALRNQVCAGYRLESKAKITFNANEKKLICGDPKAGSWADIPQFQAEYFISTFLQDRGYFFPTYTKDGDTIVIHPGEQAHITSIAVEGSPPEFFDITRRRKIVGQVLTPGILNTLQNWVISVLKTHAYACPMVQLKAYPETGEVTVNIDPGKFETIAQVIEEPVEGLRPGTLERYRAFRIGDPYNSQNLALTSTRIEMIDGILQSSYFLTECTDEGAVLTQKSLTGPKRLVRVGVGVSTEDMVIGKLQFKWLRMGSNGSSIDISARGSYRRQWLNTQGFIYFLPYPSRWHLNPATWTRRQNEKQFEYLSIDTGVPAAVTWETQNVGFRLRFGPHYLFVRTWNGAVPGNTHFVMGGLRLDVTGHDYFYEEQDPQRGFMLTTYADFSSDKVGSSATAQMLGIQGQSLWNLWGFDPPLLIIALRGSANVTITNTGSASFPRLPPPFLNYLGGSANMRGFSRDQLPNANRGALTALYVGGETRLANVVPLNIQPLSFFDIGAMGQRSMNLDFPVYASLGFGVRWPSMVGVFRMTLGRGFLINNNNPANNNLEHWQFYFSYGEEF